MLQQDDIFFYLGSKNASADDVWFYDQAIDCNDHARAYIAGLCSLPFARVPSLYWKRDYFEIQVLLGGRRKGVLLLKRYKASESSIYKRFDVYKRAGDLVILADAVGGAELVHVASELAKRLNGMATSDLFLGVFGKAHDDSEAPVKGESKDRHAIANLSDFPYFDWGSEHVRNLFMFPAMIKGRARSVGIDFEDLVTVEHCDIECALMDSRPDRVHHLSYLRIPQEDTADRLKGKAVELYKKYNIGSSIMKDKDVICGGLASLKCYLDSITDIPEVRRQNLLVACGCTPLIIGDDIASLVKNINKKKKAHIAYYDPLRQNKNAADIYIQNMKQLISRVPRYAAVRQRINLIGFPEVPATQELVSMLSSMGVEVNARLLPAVSMDICTRLYKASLQVFFPNEDYAQVYAEVFHPLSRKYCMPEAPYGFSRTDQWIKAINNGRGTVRCSPTKAWTGEHRALRRQWEQLKKEAHDHSVGLVISTRDMDRLCDPQKNVLSVPLLQFLGEMGFRLEVLIYCHKDDLAQFSERIERAAGAAVDCRVLHCQDTAALSCWLAETACTCVYSDLAFDQRLACAGKSSFSVFDLEMGYHGAVRSIARLLRKCKDTFFSTYKGYFNEKAKVLSYEN